MALKRGSPMKRTGGLRRRPMSSDPQKPSKKPPIMSKKRKSPKRKSRYALRERDYEYMGWVKTLPCLLACTDGAGHCSWVIEADHAGLDAGLTRKAPDDTCIPLCSRHHLDRHACTGFFRKREDETYAELKQRKRDWRLEAIAKTQAAYPGPGNGITEGEF